MGCLKLAYRENESFLKVVREDAKTKADSSINYFPFGMVMPGRSYTSSSGEYRFGFNGMEKDGEEWSGNAGNQLDFGARIYDSRLGRWLKVDPLAGKQPGWSPYKSFLNNPIVYQDPDGETEYNTVIVVDVKSGNSVVIRNPVSDKVQTDGVKHMVSSSLGSYYVNKYYDFETTQTLYLHENGEVTASAPVKRLVYEHGSSEGQDEYVIFGGDKAGDTKETSVLKGGYVFMSKEGRGGFGPGEKVALKDLHGIENMDVIIQMIGAVGNGGKFSTPKKIEPKTLEKNAQDLAKAFSKIVKEVDHIIEERKKNGTPVSVVCDHGGSTNDTIPYEDASSHPMSKDTIYE